MTTGDDGSIIIVIVVVVISLVVFVVLLVIILLVIYIRRNTKYVLKTNTVGLYTYYNNNELFILELKTENYLSSKVMSRIIFMIQLTRNTVE